MADNSELKNRTEVLEQEVEESRNQEWTINNNSRVLDGSRMVLDGSVLWIPRLNLRDEENNNYMQESNQTTERMPEPERKNRNLLDGVHTDRVVHKIQEPAMNFSKVMKQSTPIMRSKSSDIFI